MARLRPPDPLVILRDMKVGTKGVETEHVTMEFDQHMGKLYPFTLEQKLALITEPCRYYTAAGESLKVIVNGSQVHFNDLLDFGPDPNPGSSISVFRMELSYLAPLQELRVRLFDEGGSDYLANTVSVDLGGFGPSHIGFSARTGGFTENHDVRTWSHSAVAVP